MLAKGNVEETPELRKTYNIVGTPTVLLLKPGGEEIDRTLGFMKTAEFIATMEGFPKGIGTLKAMMAEEPAKSRDPVFMYRLGSRFQAHNRLDEADARFDTVVALDPENKSGLADSAFSDKAWDLGKRKDYEGAAAQCREIARRWPNGPMAADAVESVGWYASKAGKKDEAIAAYQEYLAKWPQRGDTTFVRGQIIELQKPPAPDSGK